MGADAAPAVGDKSCKLSAVGDKSCTNPDLSGTNPAPAVGDRSCTYHLNRTQVIILNGTRPDRGVGSVSDAAGAIGDKPPPGGGAGGRRRISRHRDGTYLYMPTYYMYIYMHTYTHIANFPVCRPPTLTQVTFAGLRRMRELACVRAHALSGLV